MGTCVVRMSLSFSVSSVCACGVLRTCMDPRVVSILTLFSVGSIAIGHACDPRGCARVHVDMRISVRSVNSPLLSQPGNNSLHPSTAAPGCK